MEGMRILDEWPIVEKVVRSLQVVFEKVPVDMVIEIEGTQEIDDVDDDFDFDLGGDGGGGGGRGVVEKEAPEDDKIRLTRDEGAVYNLLDGFPALFVVILGPAFIDIVSTLSGL